MASRDKKPEIKENTGNSEIMHRLKTHPFLFIGTVLILVIVIVAFVFVPAIVPNTQMGLDLIFGYYNKTPVKLVQNNYFHQMQQSLREQMQVSADNPNYLEIENWIWRSAYEQAAIQIGVLDEMKRAGYAAPETVVDREVARLPMFLGNDGSFSSAKYRAVDNNSLMRLWRQVKDSVTVENYVELSQLNVASQEASFAASMASSQRVFDLAVFPFSSFPESEVISYGEANPDLFRTTHFSRITVTSSADEARRVLEAVKSGTSTFEEAAQTNSQDWYADVGGDMGLRMVFELMDEIPAGSDRDTLINLTKGSLSDVIEIASGWAFFRVEEEPLPFDSADTSQVGKIRNYIMANNRGQVEDWLRGEAEKFSARVAEVGFENAVTEGSVTRHTLGPIPVNFGDSSLFTSVGSSGINELSGASTNQFFWEAAFSTPIGTLSAPIVMGDNIIALIPEEEVTLEETETESIVSYYPSWITENSDAVYRNYFLTSEKFDDRFDETYARFWGTN